MFISFEGIDGCGKSTHARLLKERIEAAGKEVVLTHEPGGGGKIGESIRNTILLEEMKSADPLAEVFLFCADRVHHVRKVVKPALDGGKTVISDRFFDSTIVYQGCGRGVDFEFVERAARMSALGVEPDLTFFLDAPVEVCAGRLEGRQAVNRMDKEAEDFYKRLRKGFLSEAKKHPARIQVVDASGEIEETAGKIGAIADEKIGTGGGD
ncbi:MAG: dTMP kinase [Thermodesulfobacteriota bacterium]